MKRESNQWTTTEHSSTNDFTLNRPIKVTMVISSRYHPIICNIMLLTLSITLSEGKHNGFNTLRGSIVDKYHYSFHSPISSLASSSLSSPSTWKTGTTPSSESSSKSPNSQWKPNPLSSLINVPTISSFNINHDHLGKSLGKNDSKLSAHFSTLFNSTHDNYKQPVNMLINNQSKEMPSSIGKQSSSSSSPYSSSSQPFIRLGKRSSASESLPNHVMRDSCSDDQECLPSKTKCMVKEGLCGCSPGYMDITSSESSYVSKFCFKLKRNGEHCEHSAQCFVSHSTCERINPPILNNQSGTCQCKQGFNEQGGDEVADVNGYEIKSDRICVPVVVVVNKTYMKITVALSVLTIAALIACTFIVIKIKRNKRQAQTETAVATSINGSQYDQGQRGQHVRDLGNPPPMGSAEAEFQNDFIQVFPMHHLEPCPEKNMTALIMQ